jgi:hypothetical protein
MITSQKYVFYPRKAHILDRLDITVLYAKICISSLWDSYSVSIRRFGVIHKILSIFRKYQVSS